MKIKIKDSECTLKFTFNSFNYLEDFDTNELGTINAKPFKMIRIVKDLLLGAMNHNPEVVFSESDVEVALMEYMENGNIADLFADLIELLEDSDFFKSLQKTKPMKKKK